MMASSKMQYMSALNTYRAARIARKVHREGEVFSLTDTLMVFTDTFVDSANEFAGIEPEEYKGNYDTLGPSDTRALKLMEMHLVYVVNELKGSDSRYQKVIDHAHEVHKRILDEGVVARNRSTISSSDVDTVRNKLFDALTVFLTDMIAIGLKD